MSPAKRLSRQRFRARVAKKADRFASAFGKSRMWAEAKLMTIASLLERTR